MAGSGWSDVSVRQGLLNNSYARPVGYVKTFTADDTNGSIPANEAVPNISGLLTGIDVEFSAVTPPNSLIVAIKTVGGITLVTSAALVASGRITVSPPVDVCGGYQILCTNNTTNSAIATIVALFR